MVGNIQACSIHDGPGIRSTVFLKGCPLRCAWCHNPEYQTGESALLFQPSRCIACGECVSACPEKALSVASGKPLWDKERCLTRGNCARACPTGAIELCGRRMTSAEVLEATEKDAPFFDASGGGITLSGGEPMMQPEFALDILRLFKARGIHTAVDTCGYGSLSSFMEILPYTDLFLYDIKTPDDDIHLRYTGVGNKLIFDNLRALSARAKQIWLRLPIIPGISDDPSQVARIGRTANELGLSEVYLLPYHDLADAKYRRLGLANPMARVSPPRPDHLKRLCGILAEMGLNAHIGG